MKRDGSDFDPTFGVGTTKWLDRLMDEQIQEMAVQANYRDDEPEEDEPDEDDDEPEDPDDDADLYDECGLLRVN